MARLCIRIAANDHPDQRLDAMRTHEGDVVCVVDDNHQFSFAELNNGQYRIIDVPGVPQGDLIHLCEHAEDADGKMIRRRVRALDISILRGVLWRNRTSATVLEIVALTILRNGNGLVGK